MPETPEIDWGQNRFVEKSDLAAGILQWVRHQTGIDNARLAYLHQLTRDDMILMAMAIGFVPPPRVEKVIRDHYVSLAEQAALREAKWEAADAVRNNLPIALPGPTEP